MVFAMIQGAIKGIQPKSVAPRDNHYMATDPDSIRKRAEAFSEKWSTKPNLGEKPDAQTFINEFFAIFAIDRDKSQIHFEYSVDNNRKSKKADVFWPDVLLIENKSPGEDLDETFEEAKRKYYDCIVSNKPRYILCNDFHRFRLTDMHEDEENHSFKLKELPEKLNLFEFMLKNKHEKLPAQRPRAAVIPLLIASVMSFLLGFGTSEIELDHEIHRIYRDMTGTEKAL